MFTQLKYRHLLLCVAVLGVNLLETSQSYADTIGACVKRHEGRIRIVEAAEQCRKNESFISWSTGSSEPSDLIFHSVEKTITENLALPIGRFISVGAECPVSEQLTGGGCIASSGIIPSSPADTVTGYILNTAFPSIAPPPPLGQVFSCSYQCVLAECAPNVTVTARAICMAGNTDSSSGDQGYVFSRTDVEEFRWIDTNDSGVLGSIWIDMDCADRLGPPQVSGGWNDLITLAPGFDTIENPCI